MVFCDDMTFDGRSVWGCTLRKGHKGNHEHHGDHYLCYVVWPKNSTKIAKKEDNHG